MIRWYDYPLAFIAADFIIVNLKLALSGNLIMSLMGAAGIYLIMNLWNTTYTSFRVKQELKR
ncbi:hypothetical protein N9E09_00665 [bacterium]|jgi:hypothetical protein|nr:hypothetical protein [bacterium]